MSEQILPTDIMIKAARGIGYISHPLRLRILEFLDVNDGSPVSGIAKGLGVEQMIVSQNLKKLREAHLVQTERHGVFIYYRICEEYPASVFVCIRKLFGYMTDNFYFLKEDYKALLPKDYTTMVANRIKLFAHIDKMRILDYLYVTGKSTVGDIAAHLRLPPLKVSQLLKKMKDDEFVSCQRQGRYVFYEILKGVHWTAIACIRKRYTNLRDKSQF